MPYAAYVLTAAPFLSALGTAVSMSFVVLVPLVITDRLFYGKWTVGVNPFISCSPAQVTTLNMASQAGFS